MEWQGAKSEKILTKCPSPVHALGRACCRWICHRPVVCLVLKDIDWNSFSPSMQKRTVSLASEFCFSFTLPFSKLGLFVVGKVHEVLRHSLQVNTHELIYDIFEESKSTPGLLRKQQELNCFKFQLNRNLWACEVDMLLVQQRAIPVKRYLWMGKVWAGFIMQKCGLSDRSTGPRTALFQ